MSIIGSLFKLITAIIKKVFRFFAKLFKAILPLLIAVAVIYFGAPYLATFFTGIGAPAWLTTAITSLPGYIKAGLSYAWDLATPLLGSIKEGAGKVWGWFSQLELGTQAMIALGTSYAVAPEETAALIEDVATGIGDLAETVISSALGGGLGLLLVAGAAFFFLSRKEDPEPVYINAGGYNAQP